MPKISPMGPASVPVTIFSQSSNEQLGQVDLPVFCVDHMRMTPAEANLATMVRHVQMRLPNIKIRDVFVDGHKVSGIAASQVEKGIALHVTTE